MKKYALILIAVLSAVLITLTGCSSKIVNHPADLSLVDVSSNLSKKVPEDVVFSQLDKLNSEWMASFNNASGLGSLYTSQVLLFSGKDPFIKGTDAVIGYYKKLQEDISEIKSINVTYRQQVNSRVIYELGEITVLNNDTYQYLLIWKKKGDMWLRDLEAIACKNILSEDFSPIRNSKLEWVELSKQRDAKELVRELYTNRSVYYNLGTVIQGQQDISCRFSFMEYPGYSLNNLVTKSIANVQPGLTYEIIEWVQDSSTGYYVCIWVRDTDGKWKISLHSNE